MANRKQLYKYKGNRCACCGLSVYDIVARYGTFERMYHLHHINPEIKDSNYNNLIRRTISAEQIAEIDKCVLLCTVCHGLIHAQNINVTLEVSIEFENKVVSQKLKGWFIADNLDKTLTFVTNEKFLLEPCVVIIGQDEELLCLKEIDSSYLEKLLKNCHIHKTIVIFSSLSGRLLLKIESLKENKVKVTQRLGIPFFSIDFKVEKGNCSDFWIRNGIMLTKDGDIRSEGTFSFLIS